MSGVVAVLSVTEQTLIVSNIEEDEFGAYTCNVTNSAGLSETAEITIEQGGMFMHQRLVLLCVQLYNCIFHYPA